MKKTTTKKNCETEISLLKNPKYTHICLCDFCSSQSLETESRLSSKWEANLLKISVASWKPSYESSKTGFDVKKSHMTKIHHLPQEPHSHGLTVATAEILHCGYFKLRMCGRKRNQQKPDFSCYQHCRPRPKWHISATSRWTFSAGSQASPAFQRREDPAFGSTSGKSNLTYQENAHCVGKCRLSPELLNLEGGKEKIQYCYA